MVTKEEVITNLIRITEALQNNDICYFSTMFVNLKPTQSESMLTNQKAKIVFTEKAAPISDFDANSAVEKYYQDLSKGVNVYICNQLLLLLLRAKLLNDPLKFQVDWYFEDELGEIDNDMRSHTFFDYPVLNLDIEAVMVLLEPSKLTKPPESST